MTDELYNELSQVEGFDALSQGIKAIFKEACSHQQSDKKSISFTALQANNLFCENSLDSPTFPKVLNFFEDVSIAMNYSSKIFGPLFNSVTKLKEKEIYAALGWLAREGKVAFDECEDEKDILVRLLQ